MDPFLALTSKKHGVKPNALGRGTLCPNHSNYPLNTGKQKKFKKMSKNFAITNPPHHYPIPSAPYQKP